MAFVPVVSGEWDVVAFSVFPAALHVDAWSADVAAAAGRVEGRKVGRLKKKRYMIIFVLGKQVLV